MADNQLYTGADTSGADLPKGSDSNLRGYGGVCLDAKNAFPSGDLREHLCEDLYEPVQRDKYKCINFASFNILCLRLNNQSN